MKFFHYSQNNSGGSFNFDKSVGITHNVIIEAESAFDANTIAESIGLYFDGCEAGRDCNCCGDRWYPQYSDNLGEDLPMIYGQEVDKNNVGYRFMPEGQEVAIHYKSGEIVWF